MAEKDFGGPTYLFLERRGKQGRFLSVLLHAQCTKFHVSVLRLYGNQAEEGHGEARVRNAFVFLTRLTLA